MKKVLIMGGGFAGIETFRRLHELLHPAHKHDIRIELISRNNFFTFTPMLHEAATGSVAREHLVQPIREMLVCCGKDFHEATIANIDPDKQVVYTDADDYSYDIGVVALGVEQGYFGTPGAKEHAVSLKWLPDAITMRNRIIDSFEKASERHDDNNLQAVSEYLHFVIVGGGLTGTELAGQLSDLISHEMRLFYGDVPHIMTKITLVHAGPRIIEQFSPQGSQKAARRLEKLGVEIRLGEVVTEVTAKGAKLKSGEFLNSKNVFWTAGTQSALPTILPAELLTERGLLKTEPTLQVTGYKNLFGVGDCRVATDQAYFFPPTAQAAVQSAEAAAYNISHMLEGKKLLARRYHHRGDIIPIGDWYGVFERGSLRGSGRFIWLLRRLIFLMSMYGWANRLQVSFDWFIALFLPRDTSEF